MATIIAATRANQHAAFACAICLATPQGETATYLGYCHGTIAPSPRGTTGFGYDPIFIPTLAHKSFAEFTKAEKSAISHRGRALRKFIAAHCR